MHKNVSAFWTHWYSWRKSFWTVKIYLQCCHCDTEFEVFRDWHILGEEKHDTSTLCSDKESPSSLTKAWGCMICHSNYDSSILRTEEISYNCHAIFLSKLRRLWSPWNLGMLQWYSILLGYGCLKLCFDFSEPNPKKKGDRKRQLSQ